MPGSWRSLALVVFLSLFGCFVLSCAKDPLQVDRNRPPETYLVSAPVDTTVATLNYSYRVHLYWRGEDSDGYVVGFLYSWDDSSIGAFRYTTKTDSIFELEVNDSLQISGGTGTNPGNAKAHAFYIRAVDNLGKPDPSLTIFSRRQFVASTTSPMITFVGGIPSGTVEIDTLYDGAPLSVCWSGRDDDGVVTRYRYDIGTYRSSFISDSCAYFNDPGTPGSVPLPSGLYTMTVSAIDNANAVGINRVQFVVNRDPETWFLPKGSPIGHYIQPYLAGQRVDFRGTFAPGDTVPYRSTVWWEWDGEDSQGGFEANCLSGWSFTLQPGTRDNRQPYIIGFLDTLTAGPPLVRFNTNDPDDLGPVGFTTLILDSLDEGTSLIARVASRDCSNRADGTAASFRFNCNFPPKITGLTYSDVIADPDGTGAEPCKSISWTSEDFEDGLAEGATVTLDDTQRRLISGYSQGLVVPDRVFRALTSGPTHTVRVRVKDRAEIFAPLPEGELLIQFNIPTPTP